MVRRIAKALSSEKHKISRYKAIKLMQKAKLSVRVRKKYKVAKANKQKQTIAENILNRNFKAKYINKVWCNDNLYIWTNEGWLHLATVIDLYSRKVVGWSIDKRIKVSLVEEALNMAYLKRRPEKGTIHHSDQGVQYSCRKYQDLLKSKHFICSMSRKGNC